MALLASMTVIANTADDVIVRGLTAPSVEWGQHILLEFPLKAHKNLTYLVESGWEVVSLVVAGASYTGVQQYPLFGVLRKACAEGQEHVG